MSTTVSGVSSCVDSMRKELSDAANVADDVVDLLPCFRVGRAGDRVELAHSRGRLSATPPCVTVRLRKSFSVVLLRRRRSMLGHDLVAVQVQRPLDAAHGIVVLALEASRAARSLPLLR